METARSWNECLVYCQHTSCWYQKVLSAGNWRIWKIYENNVKELWGGMNNLKPVWIIPNDFLKVIAHWSYFLFEDRSSGMIGSHLNFLGYFNSFGVINFWSTLVNLVFQIGLLTDSGNLRIMMALILGILVRCIHQSW